MVSNCVELSGLELVELEQLSRRGTPTLVLTVDRPEGVDVETCARLNRELSALLEAEPDYRGNYAIEVGSPGLTRPLRKPLDYQRFAGRLAVLHLNRVVEGRRRVRGQLLGLEADQERVRVEDETSHAVLQIPLEAVARAHLDFDFPAAPGRRRQVARPQRGRP